MAGYGGALAFSVLHLGIRDQGKNPGVARAASNRPQILQVVEPEGL
jgi:hypothetical protein